MRFTNEQLEEIRSRTTATAEDNAAVVLPLIEDLIESCALEADRDLWKERAESAEAENSQLGDRLEAVCDFDVQVQYKLEYMKRAESAEALLASERELKELARSRWQEAQNRLANIERSLISITGIEQSSDDNLAQLEAERERATAIYAAAEQVRAVLIAGYISDRDLMAPLNALLAAIDSVPQLGAERERCAKQNSPTSAADERACDQSGRNTSGAPDIAEAQPQSRVYASPGSAADKPPCSGCGGRHPFDTVIPSAVWNAVIRHAELPEYLCTTCIVRAFVRANQGFTATLWGDGLDGVSVEFIIGGNIAIDAALISEENTTLRAQFEAERANHPDARRLQERVAEWVRTRIGPAHMDRKERAMRLLEEAIELAQAEGITSTQVWNQMNHVYHRAPGIPAQEAGGVAVCLLGWCASSGVQLLDIASAEVERIEAKPIEEIRGSLARKADADLVTAINALPVDALEGK